MLVITPISTIIVKIPAENISDKKKAVLADALFLSLTNPMIKGMLERWHGLNNMLSKPQVKAAIRAIKAVDCKAAVRD